MSNLKNENIMKKAIIWFVWVTIWITPAIVAMCGDNAVLMLIALIWSVILYKFTMWCAPNWMKDVLKQVFVDENVVD